MSESKQFPFITDQLFISFPVANYEQSNEVFFLNREQISKCLCDVSNMIINLSQAGSTCE